MTEAESYRFDIFGFIIVRDVLSPDELAACNKALDRVPSGAELPAAAAERPPFRRANPGVRLRPLSRAPRPEA